MTDGPARCAHCGSLAGPWIKPDTQGRPICEDCADKETK